MSAVSERLAAAPRVPWRVLAVAALLLVAIVAAIALIAGSRQPRVPAPFGPAANGLIAYVDDAGAIRAVDPAGGTSRVVVSGPGHQRPVFSPDGTRLVYLQLNAIGDVDIVVASADGSSPRVLTQEALVAVGHLGWAPDGRRVVVAVPPGKLLAFDVAGGAAPAPLIDQLESTDTYGGLDSFNPGMADLFRPPAGDEILYLGSGPDGNGLYRRSLSGGAPIPVLTQNHTSVPFSNLAAPQWSPDGTRIVVTIHPPDNPDLGRVYVVNADGSGLRRLSRQEGQPGEVVDEEHATWSPDGTRVAFGRWVSGPDNNDVKPVTVVEVAGGRETELPNIELNGYAGWQWSPDGRSILEIPGGGSADVGQVLVIDLATLTVTRLGSASDTPPSWQRMLP